MKNVGADSKARQNNPGEPSGENAARRQYINMTQTPISRLIAKLSVPTIISMLVTNIYNTADTYFVSRLDRKSVV